MNDFKAVTERGAVYERKDGNIFVKGRYIHNAVIKVVPSALFDSFHENKKIDWDALNALPVAEVPVVGDSILVYAFKEWKISTSVVELS